MRIRSDLSERAVVDTRRAEWVPSPEIGVERILLDRDGGEIARATSIVRYAPGARFPAHVHGGGEEFLVLDGEFRDADGIYAAGSYVRNPPGSRHAPWSESGCTLFVKLWQIPADDGARVCAVAAVSSCVPRDGESERANVLHATAHEWVAIVALAAGHCGDVHEHAEGEEIFVLAGELEDELGTYETGIWLRQPRGSRHRWCSRRGAVFYVKRGFPRAQLSISVTPG
jgi:anti-sigma factor ChrR (cupin superfamily)